MTPVRIQRKRTKGWRMPENTVFVGRPTKWGNRYRVGEHGTAAECVAKYRDDMIYALSHPLGGIIVRSDLKDIRGKNLACFCPLDSPCHADVLLELANSESER